MGFCSRAWSQIADIRDAIHNHPFIMELKSGHLSTERFCRYIGQDRFYLADFSRVLSLLSARAPSAEARFEFSHGARTAVEVEKALHQNILQTLGGTMVPETEPNPACLGYTSYLLGLAATRSFEEAVAGILPCFWIYCDVGEALAPFNAPQHPYAAWIRTYSDPSFLEATARMQRIADRAAEQVARAQVQRMLHAFVVASRYEWMFWDNAYRNEGWPLKTSCAEDDGPAISRI